jgi:hypothetical protein
VNEDKIGLRLAERLQLRSESDVLLSSRESEDLEYKETFGLRSVWNYARTMASFANRQGGWIVFGVKDQPRSVIGVNDLFDTFDPAKFTGGLSPLFSPEIQYTTGSVTFAGKELGYIYTYESSNKPVVAMRDTGDWISGAVFYRYSGQTRLILGPDLREMIQNVLRQQREDWLRHTELIAHVGPGNIGLLNLETGSVDGTTGSFVIDERLLPELQFIKEGTFVDTGGDPAVKIIGEARPYSGVVRSDLIPESIREPEIVEKFLSQRELGPEEAKEFLRAAARDNVRHIPVRFFAKQAELTSSDAAALVENMPDGRKDIRDHLAERLRGRALAMAVGAVNGIDPETDDSFKPRLETGQKAIESRTELFKALTVSSDSILANLANIPVKFVPKLLEAITHLHADHITRRLGAVLQLLGQVRNHHYEELKSLEKTTFRKAVAKCDEVFDLEPD